LTELRGGQEGVRSVACKASAARDAHAAVAGYPRRTIRRRIAVMAIPAILRPFPHVAMDIMKAEFVGGESSDRRRPDMAIGA